MLIHLLACACSTLTVCCYQSYDEAQGALLSVCDVYVAARLLAEQKQAIDQFLASLAE